MSNEEKGLIKLVDELIKEIDELNRYQEKIGNDVRIAVNLANDTDNVDNLKLIINDMSKWTEHIIDKDTKLFADMNIILSSLQEVFQKYESLWESEEK